MSVIVLSDDVGLQGYGLDVQVHEGTRQDATHTELGRQFQLCAAGSHRVLLSKVFAF